MPRQLEIEDNLKKAYMKDARWNLWVSHVADI